MCLCALVALKSRRAFDSYFNGTAATCSFCADVLDLIRKRTDPQTVGAARLLVGTDVLV